MDKNIEVAEKMVNKVKEELHERNLKQVKILLQAYKNTHVQIREHADYNNQEVLTLKVCI